MKTLMLIVALAFSGIAHAQGGKIGNGGNSVVCYQSERDIGNPHKITSIELFDYWEGVHAFPDLPEVDLGGENLSVAKKIDIFLERVRIYDHARYERYSEYAKVLLESVNDFLVDQLPLVNIDDDTPRAIPTGRCNKVQFAVQFSNPPPGKRRFAISRPLYLNPVTTNTTRAGILLHELVYRDAILNEHVTRSDGARVMNYVYSGNSVDQAKFDAVMLRQWYRFARLPFMERNEILLLQPFGVRVLLDLYTYDHPRDWPKGEHEFDLGTGMHIKSRFFEMLVPAEGERGVVLQVEMLTPGVAKLKSFSAKFQLPDWIEYATPSGVNHIVPEDTHPEFPRLKKRFILSFSNDRLSLFYGDLKKPLNRVVDGIDYSCETGQAIQTQFDLRGNVKACAVPVGTLMKYKFEGQTLELGCLDREEKTCIGVWGWGDPKRLIIFDNDGNLKRGYTEKPFQVRLAGTSRMKSEIKGWFYLSKDGELTAGRFTHPYTWSNGGFKFSISNSIQFKPEENRYYADYHGIQVSDASPAKRGFVGEGGAGEFCNLAFGTSPRYAHGSVSPERKLISKPTALYDLKTGAYRNYVDEYVYYSENVSCFEFALPF